MSDRPATLAENLALRREAEKSERQRHRETLRIASDSIMEEIGRKRAPDVERKISDTAAMVLGVKPQKLTNREKYNVTRDWVSTLTDDERDELRDSDNPWWKSRSPEERRYLEYILRRDAEKREAKLSLEDYAALEKAPESEEEEYELDEAGEYVYEDEDVS